MTAATNTSASFNKKVEELEKFFSGKSPKEIATSVATVIAYMGSTKGVYLPTTVLAAPATAKSGVRHGRVALKSEKTGKDKWEYGMTVKLFEGTQGGKLPEANTGDTLPLCAGISVQIEVVGKEDERKLGLIGTANINFPDQVGPVTQKKAAQAATTEI